MLHNMRVLAVGDHFFIISKMNKTSCFKSRKQYRVLLELHITQRQLESPGRQNAAQLKIWNIALCYFNTTRKQCVSIFSKDDRNFFFMTND